MLAPESNIPDLNGDLPFAFLDVVAHGRKLHRQRLLVVRGHSRIEAASLRYPPWPKTLAEGAVETADFAGIRRCRYDHTL